MASEAVTSLAPSSGPVVGTNEPKLTTPELSKQVEKQPEVDFAARFAALTRKERELLSKTKQFSQKEKDIQDKVEKALKWEGAQKEAKKNPVAFLESLGLSYKEITDFILNDNKPTPDALYSDLQSQLQAEKQARTELEDRLKNEKNEAAITSFKYAIKSHVDSKADAYELIRSENAYDTVFEVAEQVFNDTGEVPDIGAISDQVEKHLEGELERFSKLKKFQAKFAPPPPQPEDGKTNGKPQPSRTLTNEAVSSMPAQGKPKLSEEESKKRAAALLKWS